MAVNINFEDIEGKKRSLAEREILREVEIETEDGVPAVALDTTQGFYVVEDKMWHDAKARVEKIEERRRKLDRLIEFILDIPWYVLYLCAALFLIAAYAFFFIIPPIYFYFHWKIVFWLTIPIYGSVIALSIRYGIEFLVEYIQEKLNKDDY
ncbi:MAG: hypothetical protein [Bacteriophage sp.]|nr:MAG: hypothetical protein [Bacteriophage sp.]